MWEHRTAACVPSCWASPLASAGRSGSWVPKHGQGLPLRVQVLWATPEARDWKSGHTTEKTRERKTGRPLNEQVLWATPTLNGNTNRKGMSVKSGDGLRTQVMLWPTPAATDFTSNVGGGKGRVGPEQLTLQGMARKEGMMLSSVWVESLMGFPPGWTDIGGPLPADKSRTKKKRRARSSGAK